MSRILLIDLNIFAGYPSIAIGYLVSSLRDASYQVEVLSPLVVGVRPPAREVVERAWHHWERRISYSSRDWIIHPRRWLGGLRTRWRGRGKHHIVDACREHLQGDYDLIMISAYTDELMVCEEIARMVQARGIPLLIGGPIFSQASVAELWAEIPGVTAVVGAESERSVAELVQATLTGNDLSVYSGVFLPGGRRGPTSESEKELNTLPTPDFTDFPWSQYSHRIIPILASRGCGWGKCKFCGDIVTANGRGYRARAVDNVLDEMRVQSDRHQTRNFAFLDLKLNSRPSLWRQMIDRIGEELSDARWIGAVHVPVNTECGLTPQDLRNAKDAGMVRLTFGLESGSQRILDAMDKGTRVERNIEFIQDANAAGISVRATVIQGYPGETAEDLNKTVSMLEEVQSNLDRVRLNRINVLEGTLLADDYANDPSSLEGIEDLNWTHSRAWSEYRNPSFRAPEYRNAMRRLLRAVHHINRKPIQEGARAFHGMM